MGLKMGLIYRSIDSTETSYVPACTNGRPKLASQYGLMSTRYVDTLFDCFPTMVVLPPVCCISTGSTPIGFKLYQSTLLYIESISCKYCFVNRPVAKVLLVVIWQFLLTMVLPVVVPVVIARSVLDLLA